MFNKSGIKTVKGGAPTQILANVEMQASVGCKVGSDLGNADGLVLAGTPITVDFSNLTATATDGASGGNAVLLHDVDVSGGDTNGTALIFGFVNKNRVDSTVREKLTATTYGGVTILTFKEE